MTDTEFDAWLKTQDDLTRRIYDVAGLYGFWAEEMCRDYAPPGLKLRDLLTELRTQARTAALEEAAKAMCERCPALVVENEGGRWVHAYGTGTIECDAAAIRALKDKP